VTRLWAAGVFIAALVAFAAGVVIAREDEAGAIPWTAERFVWRPVIPPRPARPAPLCRASDLRVVWDYEPGFVFQGAGGSAVGGIRLANRSAGPCRLTGRPKVSFPRPPGMHQRLEQKPLPPAVSVSEGAGDDSLLPRYTLLALEPGGHAWVSLFWSNWCPPGVEPDSTGDPPGALLLTPAGGGALRVPFEGVTKCWAPRAPSLVQVDRFAPAEVPPPPDEPNLPVAIRIEAPPTARRGELLSYEVTLRNFTRKPVKLERARCPTFTQGLNYRGPTLYLNCRPAGVLERGESATFEMRYRVPRLARLGPQPFNWTLSPEGSFIKVDGTMLTILE
jgi:hypothetical protein